MNQFLDILISSEALNKMQEDAERCYPDECCGFLFGRDTVKTRNIDTIKVVRNIREKKRRRFEISADDYRKAEIFASQNDLELLGIYHSHPDHPAVASEYDRQHALPFFSYLIFSVEDGKAIELRSWQLNDSQIFEEETLLTNSLNND